MSFSFIAATVPASSRNLVTSPARTPVDGLVVLRRMGTTETLDVTLVRPELVMEAGVDVARDAAGRWHHPARLHRPRTDLSPTDVPLLTPPSP
ncbi:hypothetical protein ACH49O_40910 [Streptomyces coeruleorubidus]|uniref:hypothetical protein n=1 Tax=Streptomyces coeruleorubidus TaxID=116188 RepID=UPI0033CF19E2